MFSVGAAIIVGGVILHGYLKPSDISAVAGGLEAVQTINVNIENLTVNL